MITEFTGPRRVDLGKIPTAPPKGSDKERAKAETDAIGERVEVLLDLLNFAGSHSLLLVLQGMDAAGKDGAIRGILKRSHAQSCRVASFKVPTPDEAAHDFLWRVHRQTPARGEIVLFNRSHYEDVVITRVKGMIDDDEAERRFARIGEFETLLAGQNTIVVKLFLHISKAEQEERLVARENDPDAAWKLNVGDWQERALWSEYQAAYAEAIGRCGAPHAPWVVIPGDKKWWRDLEIARLLERTLTPYADGWRAHLETVGREAKAELATYRASRGKA